MGQWALRLFPATEDVGLQLRNCFPLALFSSAPSLTCL